MSRDSPSQEDLIVVPAPITNHSINLTRLSDFLRGHPERLTEKHHVTLAGPELHHFESLNPSLGLHSTRLLVLVEYEYMWECLLDHTGPGYTCFFGQPGIGKTCFLLYALGRCIAEKRPVALCTSPEEIYYVPATGPPAMHPLSGPILRDVVPADALILIDVNQLMPDIPTPILMSSRHHVVLSDSASPTHWQVLESLEKVCRYFVVAWPTELDLKKLRHLQLHYKEPTVINLDHVPYVGPSIRQLNQTARSANTMEAIKEERLRAIDALMKSVALRRDMGSAQTIAPVQQPEGFDNVFFVQSGPGCRPFASAAQPPKTLVTPPTRALAAHDVSNRAHPAHELLCRGGSCARPFFRGLQSSCRTNFGRVGDLAARLPLPERWRGQTGFQQASHATPRSDDERSTSPSRRSANPGPTTDPTLSP